MEKQIAKKKFNRLKLFYYIASFAIIFCGFIIYAVFRNNNSMFIFQIISRPSALAALYNPLKTKSVWSNMFIYNLPYGLWCMSGLLLIRGIWINSGKWRKIYGGIFVILILSYVFLKIPKIIPGTFDILDLIFIGFFAFMESLIFHLFIRRKIT